MAETILLTGFPGFIGMRLLPRILELEPHARIECLVQEKFLDAARQAVATLERKYGHTRSRIDLVVGDITAQGLGIEGGAGNRAWPNTSPSSWPSTGSTRRRYAGRP